MIDIGSSQVKAATSNVELVQYLREFGVKLSYCFTNIYSLQPVKRSQLLNIIKSSPIDTKGYSDIKYLADSFRCVPVKTVFAFAELNNNFTITKGYKKRIAYAINNQSLGHCLITGDKFHGIPINNDSELLEYLYVLDPSVKRFRANIGWNNDIPNIQYLEDVNTLYKWGDLDFSQCTPISKPTLNVVFCGKAFSTDSRIIGTYQNDQPVQDLSDQAEQHRGWDCIVNSESRIDVSYDYLVYSSSDYYHRKMVSLGTNRTLTVRYNQEGIVSQLAACW